MEVIIDPANLEEMPESERYKYHFLNFLKHHNYLKPFCKNMGFRADTESGRKMWVYLAERTHPVDYLTNSFNWDSTPEGGSWWVQVQIKWCEYFLIAEPNYKRT